MSNPSTATATAPQTTERWVMSVVVLCDVHLTLATLRALSEERLDVLSSPFLDGAMVFVEDGADHRVPADLAKVIAWAKAHGYEWIRFAEDGDEEASLPVYL